MKKFIGIVLVLCSLALPLAGCKEAISTVTCNTISELEDIPGQILSTPESAETEPEYRNTITSIFVTTTSGLYLPS